MATYWGIDTFACPSDDALRAAVRDHCYYIGYYLAPTRNGYRKNTSYVGTRGRILGCGLKPVPIYLASRVDDNVGTDDGFHDALDAISLATAEGFTEGTYIFLDIEQPCAAGTTAEKNYHNYVKRWVEIINGSSIFKAGIYVSASYATYFRQSIGTDIDVRYWVYELTKYTGPYNTLGTAPFPANSGVMFASMWQCAQNKTVCFNNTATLNVDLNSSNMSNPANASY